MGRGAWVDRNPGEEGVKGVGAKGVKMEDKGGRQEVGGMVDGEEREGRRGLGEAQVQGDGPVARTEVSVDGKHDSHG